MSTPPLAQAALVHDDRRGTWAMLLFIVSEATLFGMLFFAYFYLGRNEPRWPVDDPPKLMLALIMLGILLVSSLVLVLAEKRLEAGRERDARRATAATFVLGVAFLVLQWLEYRDHLKRLTPTTDAYGSIFYTITTFHGAHLVLGLTMLGYVLALPKLEPVAASPHRPLHNASLYWHFVDAIWLCVVLVLYVLPRVHRG